MTAVKQVLLCKDTSRIIFRYKTQEYIQKGHKRKFWRTLREISQLNPIYSVNRETLMCGICDKYVYTVYDLGQPTCFKCYIWCTKDEKCISCYKKDNPDNFLLWSHLPNGERIQGINFMCYDCMEVDLGENFIEQFIR